MAPENVRTRLKPLLFMLLAAVTVVGAACAQQSAPTPPATPTKAAATSGGSPVARGSGGTTGASKLGYIANVMPPTLSIFDAEKLTLVDSIVFRDLASKQQGHFLSVSPDGKYVWLGENISDTGGFVQVLDLATGEQVRRWDVGAGVANYTTKNGKYLFTSSQKTKNINVFDVANLKYLGDFPVGAAPAAPHVIDSSPDDRVLWTTDTDYGTAPLAPGGNLRSFDISGLPGKLPTALDTIKIGGNLHAVLVHPNGKYVFVGSDQSGDNVVDVATKQIVAKVPGIPHNYEISPDRKYLLSGETDYAT